MPIGVAVPPKTGIRRGRRRHGRSGRKYKGNLHLSGPRKRRGHAGMHCRRGRWHHRRGVPEN
eukprot:6805265-Heterocapsa_arctica.AAC.1